MWDGCNAVYTPLSTHSIVLVLFLIDQETWFFFLGFNDSIYINIFKVIEGFTLQDIPFRKLM